MVVKKTKVKMAHLFRGQQRHEDEEGVDVEVPAVEVQRQRQRLRERRLRRSLPPPPPRHEERKELCPTMTTKMKAKKMRMLSCSTMKTRTTIRRLCSFPTNERMPLPQARVREGEKLRRHRSGRHLLVLLRRGRRQNNRL